MNGEERRRDVETRLIRGERQRSNDGALLLSSKGKREGRGRSPWTSGSQEEDTMEIESAEYYCEVESGSPTAGSSPSSLSPASIQLPQPHRSSAKRRRILLAVVVFLGVAAIAGPLTVFFLLRHNTNSTDSNGTTELKSTLFILGDWSKKDPQGSNFPQRLIASSMLREALHTPPRAVITTGRCTAYERLPA